MVAVGEDAEEENAEEPSCRDLFRIRRLTAYAQQRGEPRCRQATVHRAAHL